MSEPCRETDACMCRDCYRRKFGADAPGARDVTARLAVGLDATVAWQYERALALFATCCECGSTGAAMVPRISDETGELQFQCTDKRVCHWRRQTRSLQRAGVL